VNPATIDHRLGDEVSAAIGARVVFAVARVPAEERALSAGEIGQLRALATDARRTEWRLGRAALKAVLRASGGGEDTAMLRFPHPSISLTHSGGVAIAAASTDTRRGLGVDLEVEREPRPAMARFFLGERERAGARPEQLLRLWTIKEAVFKADPDNEATTYLDYHVASPDDLVGEAARTTAEGVARFAYVATQFVGNALAVAAGVERDGRNGKRATEWL
jgi:4'-phosphopantetheinyl transferase EntD